MIKRTPSRLLLDQKVEISDMFRECVIESCMTLEEIQADYRINILTLKKIINNKISARTSMVLRKMIRFAESIKGAQYVSRRIEDEDEFEDIINYDTLKKRHI